MPADCKLIGVVGISTRCAWAEVRSSKNETICYEIFDGQCGLGNAFGWLESLGIEEILCAYTP